MAGIYPIQTSFARGVIADELHARVDIEQYRLSLADALNMLPLRQGGVTRRPGFQYAGKAKSQVEGAVTGMMPFRFSESQSYAIELGEAYARFFAQGGQVTVGEAPYEIVTPWTRAQALDLRYAQTSGDIIFVTHPDVPPQQIKRLGETNWVIEEDASEDGPYLDVPKVRTTITPSGRGALEVVGATASSEAAGHEADDAYQGGLGSYWESGSLANPSWLRFDLGSAKRVTGYSIGVDLDSDGYSAPRSWTFEGSNDDSTWVALDTRFGETGWGAGEQRYFTFVNEGSYRYYRLYITDKNHNASPTVDVDEDDGSPVRIGDLALQGAGPDAAVLTLTASSTLGINDGVGFVATDVGRHLRFFTEDAKWHWFKIVSRVSATVVTATLMSPPLPGTKPTGTWRLGAFSDTTGYPALVCFFQGRKVFARTKAQPRTIWMSRTEAYNDFSVSTPLVEDDAITLTVAEGVINWIADLGALLIGTEVALVSLGPADRSQGFSAKNRSFGKPYWAGFAEAQPVRCGETLLALGSFGTALREVSQAPDSLSYVAPEASILSDHLLFPGVSWMSYAQAPNSTVWLGLANGAFASLTYEREQQMASYAPHAAGGDGYIERGCVIPGAGRSELWVSVWRDDIGRTIERMAPVFRNLPQADAFHVDCGLTYAGAATATVSGAGHLNGKDVALWVDGGYEDPAPVAGGSFTIPSANPGEKITFGLAFDSFLRTLRYPGGSQDGSGLGRKKRVGSIIVDVLNSGTAQGRDASSPQWVTIVPRSFSDLQGIAPPLKTGAAREITVSSSWTESNGQIEVRSVGAAPLTVRAVTPQIQSEP